MYLPPQHAWTDQASILAFCRAHAFATLVSQGISGATSGPEAQHIPLLIDPAESGDGLILHGHAALGNPLWQAPAALAIFHGPHAYVSASWYDEDDTVPTWNYLAVHAGGDLCVIDDPLQVRDLFARLGAADPQAEVWRRRLSHEALGRMSQAIRWFRIDAVQVQAKAKLSQHHPPGRQQRVIHRLLASDDPAAQAVGLAMHRTRDGGLPWVASPTKESHPGTAGFQLAEPSPTKESHPGTAGFQPAVPSPTKESHPGTAGFQPAVPSPTKESHPG